MRSNNIFLSILKYLFIGLIFVSLNNVYPLYPFSAALFTALLFFDFKIIPLVFLYISSSIIFLNKILIISAIIQGVFLGLVFGVYRKKNLTPKIETVFFFFVSSLYFILIDKTKVIENLIISSIICLFSGVIIAAIKGINAILKRSTPLDGETVCFCVLFVVAAVGFSKLFSVDCYRFISVALILFAVKLKKGFLPAAIQGVLAIPIAFSTSNLGYFGLYFAWYFMASCFMKTSKLLASLALILAETAFIYLFKFYSSYGISQAITVAVPAIIFGFIPERTFEKIKENANFIPDEYVAKSLVNRNRIMLSSKLYDVSSVFFQMQQAIVELKNCDPICDATDKIINELKSAVCENCLAKERCKFSCSDSFDLLENSIKLGLSKGKLTLIDLPKEFCDVCSYPNALIFELNRLISSSLERVYSDERKKEASDLFALQIDGLAKVLKGLAFDFSKTLSLDKATEINIYRLMRENGFFLSGVMVFGDKQSLEVCLFTDALTAENPEFINCLSTAVLTELTETNKVPFNDESVCLTFKKTPKLDAAFGIRSVVKHGSTASGDTHSLLKLDEKRFLVALSDGMGSGEKANLTSSSALNLIEAFYKAGLDSELVLSTVNKILSKAVDDNFTALDIGIVNLDSGVVDLIKIGAPYGFIVSKENINFIEGSSIPLGILDVVSPTSLSKQVTEGDVLVMLSDGVTDAFGSSTELIEFLKQAPNKNPQALSDSIVERALFLCGGRAFDDMTAYCIRLIDRAS